MDQEPHTQYNNYSVGNEIQNFNQEYWEHISLNRHTVGTVSNHQFLQSGVEQRKERKTEDGMFMIAITGGVRDRRSIVRFTTKPTGFRTHHPKTWHLGILNILT